MKQYKIYRLVDPTISSDDEKNRIRYIGWTNKRLSDRLSNHVTEARHDKSQQHTHKNRWINKLLNLGIRPEIELVDDTDNPDEIYDYQRYIDANYLLEQEDKVDHVDESHNFNFVL